jgi:cytoskeletal protein CcmA (bactofilin family)
MLVVGKGIVVSGEIKSCDCLVVEGKVQADVSCKELRIAVGGLFTGTAAVENAEIIGRFEGELKVTERLLIRSSGKVSAKLRYRQIEIEPGGQISGDIAAIGATESVTPVAQVRQRGAE